MQAKSLKITQQTLYMHAFIHANIQQLSKELTSKNSVLISEKNIYRLYPQIFENLTTPFLIMTIKEQKKSLSTAKKIWDFFITHAVNKSHTIYIIGGGTLHDVTTFACSVYMRGLKIISIPTTLLAMTDAAIGGKNAINYRHIKNLIGTIHLPQKNIIIPEFLQTLPKQELLSGWAEIIKIALVTDAAFYQSIINHLNNSLIPPPFVIKKSIQLKLKIIRKDLHDQNIRQLLNFGHTIAHAIEGIYDEQKKHIPHGIAVAQGMMIESFIARHIRLLPEKHYQQIFAHLKKHYPLPLLQKKDIPQLLKKMTYDKKNTTSLIHFTLPEKTGKGKTKIPLDKKTLENILHKFIRQYL
ncbi:MAG: 3-dehydroquinate synthase [Bacteroidia bacterium]|nr:MAG: 3-dehydroquinate synthase [Bacteroidia bacterium]